MKFQWRSSYEPFKGMIYAFGNYEITLECKGEIHVAKHAGQRIASGRYFTDVAEACERHAQRGTPRVGKNC